MSLDPIITFRNLNDAYKQFLDSQFTFRDEKIDVAAKRSLKQECELLNGPFIEAYMPYEGKNTLLDLVNEGILNKEIYRAFTDDEFRTYKRYNHQEKAIRLANKGKSIIVASGTGSGKTECFFIPVINSILNELTSGTLCLGVRALIIYPMNALANDQMGRLRESLKNIPEITFGRYIGETPEGNRANIAKGRKEAADKFKNDTGSEVLNNELLTRAEMENNPPHILITNYAMLEYMLLRSTSQKIFNGEYSSYFKFLVLDEAHTYKGAHGTEVAMLIRRLKETIFGRTNNCLTCIGTSATLGGGEEEKLKVVDFAKDLFCEKFTTESIITSDRKTIPEVSGTINSLDYYDKLFEEYKDYDGADKSLKLFNILSRDKLIYEIRKRIVVSTITLTELADKLAKEISVSRNNLEHYIAEIIELCGQAISPYDNNPLINAKYHVFARTLEGGFITFAEDVKIFTERRKEYNGYVVWELYNCMKCGQEYIEGTQETINGDEYLVPSETGELYMLSSADSNVAVDEDDSLIKTDDEISVDLSAKQRYIMCPQCGKLFAPNISENIDCCGHKKDSFINLIKVESKNNCYKCGKFNKGTIRKLTTSEDTAVEMLTRKLYQLLPEEKKKKRTQVEGLWGISSDTENVVAGRKLLVFSDNRQEAARFAVFIQNRYNDWVWKNIIYNEIKKMDEKEISFKRLEERCFLVADENSLFYNKESKEEKQDYAKKQILKEVIELEPRMSLNRLGMINIKIGSLDNIRVNIVDHFCEKYKISEQEFRTVVYFFFDTLRRQGCVDFPEGIDHRDDEFEPKNFETYFKLKGSLNDKGRQVFGFIPSNGRTNKRLSYITNIFKKYGLTDAAAREKGLQFMEELITPDALQYFVKVLPVLKKDPKTQEYILNLENIYFEKAIPTYVCRQCGETSKLNTGVCEKTNCGGELVLIANNEDRGDYYRENFSSIKIIPMNAKEHTAQIATQEGTIIQNDFRNNNVNILSCSTTFEMGVDIGSLEAVVLRNVPPETANYIQRAGRAGRRGSSAAFILTFAKRRSHDLTYYNDPRKMINGIIKAPYIELNNTYLVRRHIHSMIFSYLSKIGYQLHTASDLIHKSEENFDYMNIKDSKDNINIIIYNLLKEKPQELFESIKKVVPEEIQKELGVDDDWNFVKKLVDNNNPDNKEACLDNAINDYLSTINELEKMKKQSSLDEKFDEAAKLKKVITTYNAKDYISFLAETNVLPRYGFPVYTVSLELNTDNVTRNRIDLTRDLRMAITEYAPGSQVVANGKYWKPYALKKQTNREWRTYDFAICDKCNKKYFYNTALGIESIEREKSCCGKKLSYKQMVIPEFGFVTQRSDKESRKLKNEAHYHSTSFFEGFMNNAGVEEKKIIINNKEINIKYSPNGEMFVVNGGTFSTNKKIIGIGFSICEKCGYVKTVDKFLRKDKTHYTANGKICNGELRQAYLGHYFKSDALVLKLPRNPKYDYNMESILYAIIEGASKFMEIDRREIGGSIWYNGDTTGLNITLFDTVPNGAGHVKRMIVSIKDILFSALEKVNGTCGCGEETCCYGCLRNYDNQIYHDTMTRGSALKYLTWLLKE